MEDQQKQLVLMVKEIDVTLPNPNKLVGKYSNKYNAYWYRFRNGGWKNKLQYIIRTPFWVVYGGLALLPWKNLNRKWWSNSYNFALRLESEDK